MSQSYKLRVARNDVPAGTVVYKSTRYDYGLASDDTRYTGVEHISVTLKEDGDYPFFTVPKHNLQANV